ncbi:hypothetical protein IX307_002936 [Bacteroides pyogenes]|nr:hypothetical protein [Bacteroides pyogenes]MBR8724721.1 hypothetical protein [Bacteroides pyogenes]MBR8738191.1 hypothetical protein [Bacteroides pyogenes]MBR8753862.1 hypothetical protein [Bacteroides pyogenes]MBR8788577.1 hypothetical protein [Bacteroides pyogenes]
MKMARLLQENNIFTIGIAYPAVHIKEANYE